MKIIPILNSPILLPSTFPLNRTSGPTINIKDEIKCPFENEITDDIQDYLTEQCSDILTDMYLVKSDFISCSTNINKVSVVKLLEWQENGEDSEGDEYNGPKAIVSYNIEVDFNKIKLEKGIYLLGYFECNGGDYGKLTGQFESITKNKHIYTVSNGYDKDYIVLDYRKKTKGIVKVNLKTTWGCCAFG